MLRLFILLPLLIAFCQNPWGFTKIGSGSTQHFSIDKIFVNPNSNPNQVFTNFNIPDSLITSIIISNINSDTVFIQKNIPLGPGEYQFFLNYIEYSNMKPGMYTFHFEFHKSNKLIYYSSIPALIL